MGRKYGNSFYSVTKGEFFSSDDDDDGWGQCLHPSSRDGRAARWPQLCSRRG